MDIRFLLLLLSRFFNWDGFLRIDFDFCGDYIVIIGVFLTMMGFEGAKFIRVLFARREFFILLVSKYTLLNNVSSGV
jgi:hypothetical protein